MSCWVVPAVAAELWGISVQQIMERIRWGHLASKSELGFTLVDVAPSPPQATAPRRAKRKPTFTLVAPAEHARPAPPPAQNLATATVVEDEEPPVEEDQDQAFDWRKARRETARLRIGPRKLAARAGQ